MIDEPLSKPPKDGRIAIRRFTLALPALLWCMGFGLCYIRGCDETDSLLKTITYTLSGFSGWLAYLLVFRPSDARCVRLASFVANPTCLQPTVPPWPFWRMLGFQIIGSILMMLLCGLIIRRIERWLGIKPAPRLSVHPLSDDQVA